MGFFARVVVLGLFVSSISVAACELVPHHGRPRLQQGTLSPFWAQEYIGAALAQAAVARYRAEGGAVEPPLVGVIESGVSARSLLGPVTDRLRTEIQRPGYPDSSHGNAVCNLINAPPPVGVGVGRLDAVVLYQGETGNDAATKMLDARVKLVNISQRRHDGGWNEEAIRRLARQSLVVWATGNTFPKPVVEFPGAPEILGAGSLTVWGGPSSYSQEGPGTHVMAPADYPLQQSYEASGHFGFGGTSGAAPLVVGALSNVAAILPDITALEARSLVEKTAVPVASTFQVPKKSGAGMLNAPKLVEVAIRLRRAGWPVDRERLLESAEIFDFTATAGRLLDEAKAGLADAACAPRQRGFAKLQEAFLLAMSDEARVLLVTQLRGEGLTGNAAFYRAFDRNELAAVLEERIGLADRDERWSLVRSFDLIPLSAVEAMLRRAVSSADVTTALQGVRLLGDYPAAATVAQVAYRHRSAEVRLALVDRGCHGEIGKEVLRLALTDADPEVRQVAADRLTGKPGKPLP